VDYIKAQGDTSNSSGMVHYLAKISEYSEKITNATISLAFKKYAADKVGISLDALLSMSNKPAPMIMLPIRSESTRQSEQTFQRQCLSVSVAARMLGISYVREPALTDQCDIEFLENFLTLPDKEMLFPLLVYLKANQGCSKETIEASLAYNPHIGVIQEIVKASVLLSEEFDANKEAAAVLNGFKRMGKVWNVVQDAT
jgi:hypothetical protein